MCVVFFLIGKEKKQLKFQAISLDMLNYISIFHSNNLHTNVVHPNLIFSSLEPTTKPSPFWNFHFDHLWQHHSMFFPSKHGQWEDHDASQQQNLHVEISKWGICESWLQVFGPIIRTHDQVFWINNLICGQQFNPCIIKLPIIGRPKTLQNNGPLSKQGFW